jgi:hypothetical protein
MKKVTTFLATLSFIFSTEAVQAEDGFVAGSTQVLIGEETISSSEIAWADSDWSGYSFADIWISEDFYITEHEVRYHAARPVYLLAEVGYNRFGGDFSKVGVGVDAVETFSLQKQFVFLRVYGQKTVHGPTGNHTVGVAWQTQPIAITDTVSVYGAGFVDIREGAPDVAEPQLWVTFKDSPVEVGTEVAIFGEDVSVYGAVKLKF